MMFAFTWYFLNLVLTILFALLWSPPGSSVKARHEGKKLVKWFTSYLLIHFCEGKVLTENS